VKQQSVLSILCPSILDTLLSPAGLYTCVRARARPYVRGVSAVIDFPTIVLVGRAPSPVGIARE